MCIGLQLLSKSSFACQLIAVTQMALNKLVLVVIFVVSVLALTPVARRWSDHTGTGRNPLDALGQLSSLWALTTSSPLNPSFSVFKSLFIHEEPFSCNSLLLR